MTRGRTWAVLALSLLLLAAAGVVGWTLWGADVAGGQGLVKYDGDDGNANRYVNLDDGDAQLSVGSPDGHRVVVQWRAADGESWSEPQTVWTDDKNVAIDNTVRYGGGTVAIEQMYSTDVHSDSDIDSFTISIVCRDGSCESKRGSGASEAQVAPDGSLRVVTSQPARGSCIFELLTSTPDNADLTSAASTTERLRGAARSDCRSYLDTYSSDWVTVHPEDHRARDFWFVRDGDAWATTYDDPSGLEIIDVGHGCCDSSVLGFVHWNDVTFGSPDGHRIQVQTHLLGDETWSEPVVLDGAPSGQRCTSMDGYEVGDAGFAVLMTCDRGRSYAVAATPDLQHWDSTFVTGVKHEPRIDDDRLAVGTTTWTAPDGFTAG